MYFDVEWEHVHMRVRLGRDWASTVGVDDLDEDRLALYMLVQRLFLVAGPMRLLDGDFPDRAFMRSIIEHNLMRHWRCCPEPHANLMLGTQARRDPRIKRRARFLWRSSEVVRRFG